MHPWGDRINLIRGQVEIEGWTKIYIRNTISMANITGLCMDQTALSVFFKKSNKVRKHWNEKSTNLSGKPGTYWKKQTFTTQ